VFSLGSEVVGHMLVHMIRRFLKLADAHTDISKTVGGWFITYIHGLFCALGVIYTNFKKFLVDEYALVTGNDRWALNRFIITCTK
jgi:hypothetical protein